MKLKAKTNRKFIAVFIACLILPQTLWAGDAVDEKPHAGVMVGDLLVARPIGIVMTVAGTAAFIVSLPFTLLAGSANEAAETLMVGPAQTTFMRCLGCRNPGYSNKDIEKNRAQNESEAAGS